jgi:DNA-binding NarL/FixJ family response regulator
MTAAADQSTRKRVLVADPHQVILDTETAILAAEFDVVGTARNGLAVIQTAADLDPDVITLDVTMPEMNGLEVARRLRAQGSRARIVFLTVHEDLDLVDEALKSGALGYVVKAAMASELPRAIYAALDGRQFISPRIRITGEDRHRT